MALITQPGLALLVIAYLGFISLGLPDAMLGVVWPSLRQTFSLSQGMLGAILVSAGSGYGLAAFQAGRLVDGLGIGKLLMLSSLLMTMSLGGFALTDSWWLFLGCAVLTGLGSGAIDAGLNAYAAAHFSTRHMNWLHACWGMGAMTGPLIITTLLRLDASWRWGYGVGSACLGLMTVCFLRTMRLWQHQHPIVGTRPFAGGRATTVLRRGVVQLQIALFLVYTGLETTVGQWSYTLLTEARRIDTVTAGVWVTLYWGGLTVGRVVCGLVVDRVGADRLLRYSLWGMGLGVLLFSLHLAEIISFLALALLGLSLAPVFPCLMARTPARVGADQAAYAVGFQVSAAMTGAYGIPALVGVIVAHAGLESVGWSLAVLAVGLLGLHEALLRTTRLQVGHGSGEDAGSAR